MATTVETVPGLVKGRGPSKNNFQNFLQTKPWQGGGVAGGGQARTGHGNWFQSMNPKNLNSRNSVILTTNIIPGENEPFTIGSSIKSRNGKRKIGRNIFGLTPYPVEDQIDRMDIVNSTRSEISARNNAMLAWIREQQTAGMRGQPQSTLGDSVTSPSLGNIAGMRSDLGSVGTGGGVEEPMRNVDQLAQNENVAENLASGLMENVDIANAMSLTPQNNTLPTIDTQGPNSFYSGLVSPRTQIQTAYEQTAATRTTPTTPTIPTTPTTPTASNNPRSTTPISQMSWEDMTDEQINDYLKTRNASIENMSNKEFKSLMNEISNEPVANRSNRRRSETSVKPSSSSSPLSTKARQRISKIRSLSQRRRQSASPNNSSEIRGRQRETKQQRRRRK